MKRFIISGLSRSGSTNLLSLLSSHPDISVTMGEVLHPGGRFESSSYRLLSRYLVNEFFRPSNSESVAGGKLLYEGLSRFEPEIWKLLKELDVSIIHSVRAERLDHVISYKLADINSVFTSEDGSYIVDQVQIVPEACREQFKRFERVDRHIESCCSNLKLPYFRAEYSQVSNELLIHRQLCNFLNVPYQPLKSHYTKLRQKSARDSVTNFHELRGFFVNTRWRELFPESAF